MYVLGLIVGHIQFQWRYYSHVSGFRGGHKQFSQRRWESALATGSCNTVYSTSFYSSLLRSHLVNRDRIAHFLGIFIHLFVVQIIGSLSAS